jgi:glycosyltransferase involved in cell wall biosynthesis
VVTESFQFHSLAFEGPDGYSRAGGIATRVSGLTAALAEAGYDTHLWFVGDPDLPGHETVGRLTLHRWGQWISRYHLRGVYDGEEGKVRDFATSLPPFLLREALRPALERHGGHSVVIAEEWHTADAVLHLDWLLRQAGIRDRVTILWNANNVFGFDRIDWSRLSAAATITTVSRYMRHVLWRWGVNALVIPNGLPASALETPDVSAAAELRRKLQNRLVLAKVARWDPSKQWLLAIETVAELKRAGWRPLLVARGGVEAHGAEVLAKARSLGLSISDRRVSSGSARGLVECLAEPNGADVINLVSPLSSESARLLFKCANAVLANSGHEPFGLVGLETMAVGGLACTGSTGEDYARPGWNALMLQTNRPGELLHHFLRLRANPREEQAIRQRGKLTAREYRWQEVIRRNLLSPLGMREPGMPSQPRRAG